MRRQSDHEAGFSLAETLIAMGVLTVGALGMAGVFASGLKTAIDSPNELIATQKAGEAIESVFSARDAHTLTWAQLRNTSKGGIFLDYDMPINLAGVDGIVNTGDSGESLEAPELARFTRKIQINDLSNELRAITVVITYPAGSSFRTYTLTSYISQFA